MPTIRLQAKNKSKKYKTSPAVTPLTAQEKVARYMRGNKSRDTKPELLLRQMLWRNDLRGYRIHWPKAPGKPDIWLPFQEAGDFVHGCFWHRCPYCAPSHSKSNQAFWKEKFRCNQLRDERYRVMYREAGWQRLVIWACQLRNHPESCLALIQELHRGVPASWEVAA